MLETAGFTVVSSMQGGISAWEGLTTKGAPEAGMAHFEGSSEPEEYLALAWLLEDGSRRFYAELPKTVSDAEAVKLFSDLTKAEQRHEDSLTGLFAALTGVAPGPDFPKRFLKAGLSDDVMEGGMKVSEALAWAKGKTLTEILELTMSIEAFSYDLYVKLERKMSDEGARQVFDLLMKEEKQHLGRMADLLGKKL